jgi:hypothetical protein
MKLSWFSRLWRCRRTPSTRTAPRAKSFRLNLDALEDRMLLANNLFVVPLNVATDAAHFHSLTSAVANAGAGDRITIEPGANPDAGTVSVPVANLTIQGDPNVPGSILPKYDVFVSASGVTLYNLNLGGVEAGSAARNLTVARSQLVNFTEDQGNFSAGQDRLTQDVITGAVDLQGDTGFATGDEVDHDTFTSSAPVVLTLKHSNQARVHDNTIVGDGAGAIGIEVLADSQSVVIANNHIDMTGSGAPIAVYVANNGNVGIETVTVSDNDLHAGPSGTGLYLNVFTGGTNFQALVQGNDFRGNHVGVLVNGPGLGSDAGKIDLGGGSTVLGSSLGGNDFHGFDGQNGHFAVRLFNTDAAAKVFALLNIFDAGIEPNKVVADAFNGGGTGDVDVSSALDANHAFVQTLYHDLLGRTGQGGELDGWAALLPGLGQGGVAHDILSSPESLDRIVGSYYFRFLGRADNGVEELGWVKALQTGALTLEQVQAGFIDSPEYHAHINTDYVQSLYINILHRTGDTFELAGWNSALPKLGGAGVAAAFANSVENRMSELTSDIQRLLARPPKPGEVDQLMTQPGDLLALKAQILDSPDYFTGG